MKRKSLLSILAAATIGVSASAPAAEIIVNSDITESVTWTPDNTYNLQGQIYVLPGATLTIEAGTVVASTPTANGSGSLAVTRGARIFVLGTESNPVIMTSTADVATWTNGDPKTGTYRQAANEWGNLTIMGNALISDTSEDAQPGNTPTPTGSNVGTMEGLTAGFPGDTRILYGGNDDDDDSGSISYLSLRYAGRVIGLANELNGLSLGGIGRGTEINNVEIMNNVDDGIEIWGGTVNLKYFSIWNVGDDSLDIDQGWRGKGQFGLIVQGYSVDASQGSGVGDNTIEIDGAEDSDAQPVTTATLYNMTVIGQPVSGDGGTAWRDGARVQVRNSIFMDLGERLVRADGDDGDGSSGYGHNGTLSFADIWTTPYTTTSSVNIGSADPAALYRAQSAGDAPGQGFLAEITDSVFWRNLASDAYTNADTFGVTVNGGSNPAKSNVVAPYNPDAPTENSPIVSITRGAPESLQGGNLTMLQVTNLDPRPANAALRSEGAAPNDGFFTRAYYRGAFAPNNNWMKGWTAADAFGLLADDPNVIYSADFANDAQGWVLGTSPAFNPATGQYRPFVGLELASPGCADCFGFWESPVFEVPAGEQVEIEFDILSDAIREQALTFRLRVNDASFRDSVVKVVTSIASAEVSPNPLEPRKYGFTYDVPASVNSVRVALDLLSFAPDDDLNSTLAVTGVKVRRAAR